MAKILSFLSWNVEHFQGKKERVSRVVSLIAEKKPDVFALYEVKGAAVYGAMREHMPDYSFTITESASPIEILVGWRNTVSCFVTQRDKLQSKVPTMRPGALASIEKNGKTYSLLFLHLKSFDEPRDWGLRDDMLSHATSLKRKIDKVSGGKGKGNVIIMGDLNTMGLSPAYNNETDFDGEKELEFVDKRMTAKLNGMRRLHKTHEESWWNGKSNWEPSKLDHAYASEHLTFKKFGNAEIEVIGWAEETTKVKQRKWIDKFSDHCALYGEIHD